MDNHLLSVYVNIITLVVENIYSEVNNSVLFIILLWIILSGESAIPNCVSV